jgi:hypothetical protein
MKISTWIRKRKVINDIYNLGMKGYREPNANKLLWLAIHSVNLECLPFINM